MYIDHANLCVLCLSLAAFLHCCTLPDVTLGNGIGALICALLGGFAVGARVSLLWQHSNVYKYNTIGRAAMQMHIGRH